MGELYAGCMQRHMLLQAGWLWLEEQSEARSTCVVQRHRPCTAGMYVCHALHTMSEHARSVAAAAGACGMRPRAISLCVAILITPLYVAIDRPSAHKCPYVCTL